MEQTQHFNQYGKINRDFSGLARAEVPGICKVCRDTGWELYIDSDGYEVAKRCSRCGGATPENVRNSKERSGVPSKYSLGVTLDDFDTEIYSRISGQQIDITKQMNAVNSFINDYYEWENNGMGLYIYSGMKGTGKSFIASCISNTLMKKYALNMKFISASMLLDRDKDDGLRDLMDIRLLVIDDLGVKVNDWMSDILFRLADTRSNNKRVTIYTSNIKMANLPFDERVVDRINEKAITITLPEISVRGAKGKTEKTDFIKRVIGGGT